MKTIEEFMSRVKVDGVSGCWEWQSYICKRDGYGKIGFDGKIIGTHRISYILHHGSIPDGLFVLHKCDNRKCVNPEHLYVGTAKDNMNDKMDRDRHFNGHSAKTHCNYGHEFTAENTLFRKQKMKNGKPWRACKMCAKIRGEKWRANKQV